MIKGYKYFNGEAECPFDKDYGKAFWWKVEMYAYQRNDEKEGYPLSLTMVAYLREHHWEGDAQSNTSYNEFIKRAVELYDKGLWSRAYICCQSYTLEEATEESRRNN